MTKAQIKAELRRCALYAGSGFAMPHTVVNRVYRDWLGTWTWESVEQFDDNEWRMFYLFIAETL